MFHLRIPRKNAIRASTLTLNNHSIFYFYISGRYLHEARAPLGRLQRQQRWDVKPGGI